MKQIKKRVYLRKIPLQLFCIHGFTPIKVCYLLCGELGDTARHREASTEDAASFHAGRHAVTLLTLLIMVSDGVAGSITVRHCAPRPNEHKSVSSGLKEEDVNKAAHLTEDPSCETFKTIMKKKVQGGND